VGPKIVSNRKDAKDGRNVQEFAVGPKIVSNRKDAKDGRNVSESFAVRTSAAPILAKFLDCGEVVVLQPFGHRRVAAFVPCKFDDRDNQEDADHF
jgi:hypothetical protein